MSTAVRRRTKPIRLSKQLSEFCSRLGIVPHARTALKLARVSFPKANNIKMFEDGDPETGEKWLSIEVNLRGNRQAARRQYQAFTAKVVELIPWPQRDSIRLLYWCKSA